MKHLKGEGNTLALTFYFQFDLIICFVVTISVSTDDDLWVPVEGWGQGDHSASPVLGNESLYDKITKCGSLIFLFLRF